MSKTAMAVRRELAAGLLATPAAVSPKFFYDPLGSRLFDAITELPEYYPTRTEAAILARPRDADRRRLPGRGARWSTWARATAPRPGGCSPRLQPQRYVAVDISVEFLREALARLQREHPADRRCSAWAWTSRPGWTCPRPAGAGPRTLFYPGSSIGNFTPDAALRFLRQAHAACQGGGLLIGVDLVKDRRRRWRRPTTMPWASPRPST